MIPRKTCIDGALQHVPINEFSLSVSERKTMEEQWSWRLDLVIKAKA